MPRKYQYSDILGWSLSRSDLFYQCKRQYFYQYYSKYVQTHPVEKIKALRSLTSVPLEVGKVVHDGIARIISGPLKHGRTQDIQPKAIAEDRVKVMKTALGSKSFIEDYYPQYPKDKKTEVESGLQKIRTSILQFFSSRWYSWLRDCTDELKSRWIIEPRDFGECRIGGLKAYCKVDFVFPDGKDGYCVVEWKTGKVDETKHKTQMLGYIFYAIDQFSVSAEKVKPLVIYLGSDYGELTITGERDLKDFTEKVKSETEEMRDYCADVDKNISLGEDKFERTSNTIFCAYCNFQEVCSKSNLFES